MFTEHNTQFIMRRVHCSSQNIQYNKSHDLE